MTHTQLVKSLALWDERVTRFRHNWHSKKKGDPRRAFWYAALVNAKQQAARRRTQLALHHISTVSAAGVSFIKEFEGFVGHPYKDAVGVWTIGYGHTEGVGPKSPHLSAAEAATLLRHDLNRKYAPPVAALKLPLNQHQFDALVSFVYNVGPGGIAPTTGVGRALRRHDWQGAADHLLDWDKGGGRTLPGLTRRRHAERTLFLR